MPSPQHENQHLAVAVEAALTTFNSFLRRPAGSDPVSENPADAVSRIVAALERNVAFVESWCRYDSPNALNPSPNIELDVYLQLVDQRATRPGQMLDGGRQPLFDSLKGVAGHILLLGGPGSGKTTALKQIADAALQQTEVAPFRGIPLLVRLRELNGPFKHGKPLQSTIGAQLSLGTETAPALARSTSSGYEQTVDAEAFVAFLDALGLIVLLDGLDQIHSSVVRSEVSSDFAYLATRLRQTRLVLTSRLADCPFSFESVTAMEIAPFSEVQARRYVEARLLDRQAVEDFLRQVKSMPYAEVIGSPLLLEVLCAVYLRVGSIPEKPKTFYRRLVALFLEDWDKQRSIRRESRYAHFNVERKFEFLSHLAFVLSTKRQFVFTQDQLVSCIRDIAHLYKLPPSEAVLIAREIESHTGLLLESGYEQYSFVHRSIQEYLCANYLVRVPSLRFLISQLHSLPDELAIATSLSSNPGLYLTALTFEFIVHDEHRAAFATNYIRRLVLESPDLLPTDDLLLALLCLAALADSADLFARLRLSVSLASALRVALKYYGVHATSSTPLLIAQTRHPHVNLPYTLELGRDIVAALEESGVLISRGSDAEPFTPADA